MRWFSRTPSFDFMAWRRPAIALSVITTIASLVSFGVRGLNLGLDFTGGVILEVQYPHAVELDAIRSALAAAGIANAQAQSIGSENQIVIRLPPQGAAVSDDTVDERVFSELQASDPTAELVRVETVGPQVGRDLTEQGGLAMLFALIGIFIYVMLRFRWKFALGAIVATLHDAIVTVGIFSLLGWEFDLTVLGAVLAVIGYSVNDTIVVYDRIRDNFRIMRRANPVNIMNASVNQTLSRTIVTGLTTLLVLFALLALGGDTLWGFSVTLILGILIGTYSSVYVASAMALILRVTAEDFAEPARGPVDDMP
jgi:preprotein translocase subunit SecF